MSDEFPVAQVLSIKEIKHDEYWLQDKIFENPSCLGLGDLTAIDKERRQSSGGRLDILLKDQEDDTMYEVEVMLGETDESHIIRTIEYWAHEKRRLPKRQHVAVLVAEKLNNRFFNVIHLISHSIPIIAIQVSVLKVAGQQFLHFSKILDTYVEEDDGSAVEPPVDRQYWTNNANITLACADLIFQSLKGIEEGAKMSFTKSYIALGGKKNFIWIRKRRQEKSYIEFLLTEVDLQSAQSIFDAIKIDSVYKRGSLRVVMSNEQIKNHSAKILEVTRLAKES